MAKAQSPFEKVFDFISKVASPVSFDLEEIEKEIQPDTEGLNQMEQFLDMVSQAESSGGTNLIQDTAAGMDTGPAFGHFGWEAHEYKGTPFQDTSGAAWTVINRAFLNTPADDPNNEWLKDLWNKVSDVPVPGKGRTGNVSGEDILALTKDQQYFIQAQSILGDSKQRNIYFNYTEATTEDELLQASSEWYTKYHWAGAEEGTVEYDTKRQSYEEKIKKEVNPKIIQDDKHSGTSEGASNRIFDHMLESTKGIDLG